MQITLSKRHMPFQYLQRTHGTFLRLSLLGSGESEDYTQDPIQTRIELVVRGRSKTYQIQRCVYDTIVTIIQALTCRLNDACPHTRSNFRVLVLHDVMNLDQAISLSTMIYCLWKLRRDRSCLDEVEYREMLLFFAVFMLLFFLVLLLVFKSRWTRRAPLENVVVVVEEVQEKRILRKLNRYEVVLVVRLLFSKTDFFWNSFLFLLHSWASRDVGRLDDEDVGRLEEEDDEDTGRLEGGSAKSQDNTVESSCF